MKPWRLPQKLKSVMLSLSKYNALNGMFIFRRAQYDIRFDQGLLRQSPFLLLIASLFLFSCTNDKEDPRPNILWLSVEDISPLLSMYGDSTANTPVLDSIAAKSLIFNRAYATVPVCAPSRSSLITGMHAVSIGTHNMRTGRDYHSWGNRDYDAKSDAVDINGDSIRLYAAVTPPEVKCFTEYLRAAGYYCTNNAKTDYQFAPPVTAWDASSNQAHWKNRPDGTPFFAVFNHGVTHESRTWVNKDLPQTVDPNSVPLPSYYPDTETVRKDVARTYSNIELLDQQLGEKLKELADSGLWENTIVFIFSDHGGPLPRGKREPLLSGLHVPMMVRFPESMKKTGYIEELVSFVDFGPTVLSLAGIDPPAHMQGRAFLGDFKDAQVDYVYGSADRFDEFSDMSRTVIGQDFVYVKHFHPERPYYKDVTYRKNIDMMNEMLAMNAAGQLDEKAAKWFGAKIGEEELFKIDGDWENMVDLSSDPAYETQLRTMREELAKWQKDVNDKGFIPERQLIDKMWPNDRQPRTDQPVVTQSGYGFNMSCGTDGASIAYLFTQEPMDSVNLDAGWQVFHQPVQPKEGDQYLYVLGTRIGYKDSEMLERRL